MTKATRTEEDLLGAREVPLEAYWGIHTLRAMENFQISGSVVGDEEAFVRGMVQVKKASALANSDLGALDPEVAGAIVWACDQVLVAERCLDQFPVDQFQGGAGTSVNMNTNEVIANLALEYLGYAKGRYDIINPNDHVNKSQSTNDAYPTGFRLGLFALVGSLIEELDRLIAAMRAKGTELVHVLKMGRTQLQDAVPMSLGQEFEAFAVLLEEEVSRLHNNAALLLEVNLGATAIGTGLNTPPDYQSTVVGRLREITGLDIRGAHDLLEATSDTGAYVSMHAAIKRLAVKLSKICNDLRLLSSGPRAGLGEIRLPERQAGSSIMPAKVNPVIPEVVNQVCFKVIGNDTTVTFAAEAGQLELNVMEPVITECLFESLWWLHNAIDTLTEECVLGITVNKERCYEMVKNSIGIVTALNPYIGYKNSTKVAKEALETNRSVYDIVLEKGLLTKEELDEALDPKNMLASHKFIK